jgi:hypothetical protein
MKINFSDMVLKDIYEQELPNQLFYKTIANLLYTKANNLDLVDIALVMNRGEEVELTKEELKEVEFLINDPASRIHAYARKAAREFIEEHKKKEKDK